MNLKTKINNIEGNKKMVNRFGPPDENMKRGLEKLSMGNSEGYNLNLENEIEKNNNYANHTNHENQDLKKYREFRL